MAIEIIPSSPALGAEIRGIDLSHLSDDEHGVVHQALLDYGYIFFRRQELAPAELKALGERWGRLHEHPYMPGLDGFPEIIEIVKNETDVHTFGGAWHTDQMFTNTPAMGTMLYAKEVPPAGGDTLFGNLYLAYESLSAGMRNLIAQLHTVIIYDKKRKRAIEMQKRVVEVDTPAEVAIHPLVRPHPETGKPVLYVSYDRITRHIEGMTEAESRGLLDYLRDHAVRPEFTSRLRWKSGTLAFWDNRCVQHMAINDYHGHRRVMLRLTVRGERTH